MTTANKRIKFTVATSVLPTWLQGAPLLTWGQIPNSRISTAQTYPYPGGYVGEGYPAILSFGGGAIKNSGSEIFVNGGGHLAWAGNEVISIQLSQNAPAWTVRRLPSNGIVFDGARCSDGRPSSRHNGGVIHYSNTRDRLMQVGGWGLYGNGGAATSLFEMFNPSTNDWDVIAGVNHANVPFNSNQPSLVSKDAAENIWYFETLIAQCARWNTASDTWTALPSLSGLPDYGGSAAHDPVRNRIVLFGNRSNFWIDPVTFPSTGTRNTFGTLFAQLNQAIWNPDIGVFLIMEYTASGVTQVDPTTYARSTFSVAGTPPPIPSSAFAVSNMVSRFFYAPELKCCIYLHDTLTNLYYFRTG